MQSFNKVLVIFFLVIGVLTQPAYSMDNVKQWINKVKPGTFPEAVKQEAPAEKKARVFNQADYKILTALQERETEIKKREEGLQKKEQELKRLEAQIEQKLDAMKQQTLALENERKQKQEMDKKDISRMVKYYESMDPENTAEFFEKMDRLTAVHILMRMNPRKASAAMQRLTPATAAEITEMVTRIKANSQKNQKLPK